MKIVLHEHFINDTSDVTCKYCCHIFVATNFVLSVVAKLQSLVEVINGHKVRLRQFLDLLIEIFFLRFISWVNQNYTRRRATQVMCSFSVTRTTNNELDYKLIALQFFKLSFTSLLSCFMLMLKIVQSFVVIIDSLQLYFKINDRLSECEGISISRL